MKVVVTGGGGYLGTLLLRELIQTRVLTNRLGEPEPIRSIILYDQAFQSDDVGIVGDIIEVSRMSGEISDRASLAEVISGDSVSVFHLAAVLTGVTERDLDTALAVNVDGARNVLDALAACGHGSKFVATSSITVYRRMSPSAIVTDDTPISPLTVYGLTKSIAEQLGECFHLTGRVDARAARLPTVVVRPRRIGVSAGASISDILRDISLGRPCNVLLKPETQVSLIDYQSCVKGLVRLHEVAREALNGPSVVNFPGLSASVSDMIAAAQSAARSFDRTPGEVREAQDAFAQDRRPASSRSRAENWRDLYPRAEYLSVRVQRRSVET